MTATTLPATTRAGTPCAATWDKKWIAEVDDREARLGRRICGARTVGCTPCLIASDHDSGRCRHHGGFALTGAPEGNRNAEMHGLYSRRLMICGKHCPAWNSCPLGGGSSTFSLEKEKVEPKEIDVGTRMGGEPIGPLSRTLSYGQYIERLPESERPLCAFEQSEYDGVISEYEERAGASGRAPARHLVHHVALLSVMVSRASRALAMKPLTEKFEQSADDYYLAMEKPTAQLAAFERLSRELRQWVRLVEQLRPAPPDGGDDASRRRPRFDEGAWNLIGTQQSLIADLYQRMSTFSLGKEKVEPKETDIDDRSRMEIRERGGVGRRDGNDGKDGKNGIRKRWGWPARAGPAGESVDSRNLRYDSWRGVLGLGWE